MTKNTNKQVSDKGTDRDDRNITRKRGLVGQVGLGRVADETRSEC